jgi:hypothetical protein
MLWIYLHNYYITKKQKFKYGKDLQMPEVW